jgi:hypothetical protein
LAWTFGFAVPRGPSLFALHRLAELCIVLLEAIAHALLGSHPLEDAAVEAAVFARGEGLGGEVVDARDEAVFDEAAECLLDDAVLSVLNLCRFSFSVSLLSAQHVRHGLRGFGNGGHVRP